MGTAFSGIDTIKWALKSIGGRAANYKHAFSIESDKHCQSIIRQNVDLAPNRLYGDIRAVKVCALPRVDLYLAGFPCQPFSTAGLRQGKRDAKHRGNLFNYCASYIQKKLPRAFVLENVYALKTSTHKDYFDEIMRTLQKLGGGAYHVTESIMNTLDHGLPHHRRRLYIVGLKRSKLCRDFKFPAPSSVRLPLQSLLDLKDQLCEKVGSSRHVISTL